MYIHVYKYIYIYICIFTADWSKTSINVLDATVSIAECVIETDLYVKPTDIHQYLLSSSCLPFYGKKSIP